MGDSAIDRTITACIAAGLGAVLVCSFVIPTIANMLGNLQTNYASGSPISDDLAMYKTLIGLVIMISIIGLLVAVIRGFAVTNDRR